MMELVIQNRTKKVWIQILSSVMRQVGDILGRAPSRPHRQRSGLEDLKRQRRQESVYIGFGFKAQKIHFTRNGPDQAANRYRTEVGIWGYETRGVCLLRDKITMCYV